ARAAREHGHLARAIVNFIEFERNQRQAPGVRHRSIDGNRAVRVMARIALQIADMLSAQNAGAPREETRRSEGRNRAAECLHQKPPSFKKKGRTRVVNEARDAAMPAPACT